MLAPAFIRPDRMTGIRCCLRTLLYAEGVFGAVAMTGVCRRSRNGSKDDDGMMRLKSGTNAGVVIVVVLLLLGLPCRCAAGLALVVLGGAFLVREVNPSPSLCRQSLSPMQAAMPADGSITVNSMQWSQNL